MRNGRTALVFKLGSRAFFPPKQAKTQTSPCIPKYQNTMGAGGEADQTDPGLAVRAHSHSQEASPSVCNLENPGILGGRNRERSQPIPTPLQSLTHTSTHGLSLVKGEKKIPEVNLQNNKGNTKYGMHFRGFPSWETIPNGIGGRGKKSTSAPGVRSAVHPYQLHGGIILFPAPQHHAHLTSGRGRKGRGKGRKGGGGRSTCPRAGR